MISKNHAAHVVIAVSNYNIFVTFTGHEYNKMQLVRVVNVEFTSYHEVCSLDAGEQRTKVRSAEVREPTETGEHAAAGEPLEMFLANVLKQIPRVSFKTYSAKGNVTYEKQRDRKSRGKNFLPFKNIFDKLQACEMLFKVKHKKSKFVVHSPTYWFVCQSFAQTLW